jgi:hypothetical protein
MAPTSLGQRVGTELYQYVKKRIPIVWQGKPTIGGGNRRGRKMGPKAARRANGTSRPVESLIFMIALHLVPSRQMPSAPVAASSTIDSDRSRKNILLLLASVKSLKWAV